MRLFVAIELPDQLKARLAAMRHDIPGARWVTAEQLHLTLAFLGELPQERLEPLCGALAGVQQHPFELSFERYGCFSHRGRPRVLWIGFEPQPALAQLADQIKKAMASCGITLEDRPFSPHVTLARLKEPAQHEVAVWLASSANNKLPHLEVREFVLFESTLAPQGAVHRMVRVFPLTAAGDGATG